MTGLRTSLASIATGGPNRAAEALAHAPLLVMSQHTPWGHASRVPGRGWRGAVPPLTPPTATARRERRTRRMGEDPRQRGGACRVARQGALRRLDAVGSGAPVGWPGAHLDRGARREWSASAPASWRVSACEPGGRHI